MSRKVEKVPGGSPRFLTRMNPFCSTTNSLSRSPGGDATDSGRPGRPLTTGTVFMAVFAAGVTPAQFAADAAGGAIGSIPASVRPAARSQAPPGTLVLMALPPTLRPVWPQDESVPLRRTPPGPSR